MKYDDNYLHKGLPDEFKVSLRVNTYSPDFEEGDRLTIINYIPSKYDRYILLKCQGKQKIVNFQEYSLGRHDNSDTLGAITSFERSVDDDCSLYLGGSPEEHYPPETCEGCDQLQFIEAKGKAVACCLTSSRLVKTSLAWRKLHCIRESGSEERWNG